MAESFNFFLYFSSSHPQLVAQLYNLPVISSEPHKREFKYDKLSRLRPCKQMRAQRSAVGVQQYHILLENPLYTQSGMVCTLFTLSICLASVKPKSQMPGNFLPFHPGVLALYAHGLWGVLMDAFPPLSQ